MGSLLVVSAILIWSSLGVFVRLADEPTSVIIFYSTVFSLPLQSLIFINRSIRRDLPGLKNLPYIFVLSVCLLLNTFTFLLAYAKTSISNAVLTHYIAPVIVAFLGALFLKEKVTWKIIASIVLATGGLWIMLGGATIIACIKGVFLEGLKVTPDLIGIASGLSSGFFYAVLIILIRYFSQRMNPYVLVFFQNLFIVLILLPFVRVFPLNKLGFFALMGALHSTMAPYLYYLGLSRIQANRAAVLGYLEPVGAIIFSMIFLSEIPHLRAYIGGAIILFSGYLTISEEGNAKKR
ncbi:MAG: DMT family transporter [Nitrospirae bacterium]|nr:MAG: DMT family transporter [Nitrospirota bacterium]